LLPNKEKKRNLPVSGSLKITEVENETKPPTQRKDNGRRGVESAEHKKGTKRKGSENGRKRVRTKSNNQSAPKGEPGKGKRVL